jgi:hypothetical protein
VRIGRWGGSGKISRKGIEVVNAAHSTLLLIGHTLIKEMVRCRVTGGQLECMNVKT